MADDETRDAPAPADERPAAPAPGAEQELRAPAGAGSEPPSAAAKPAPAKPHAPAAAASGAAPPAADRAPQPLAKKQPTPPDQSAFGPPRAAGKGAKVAAGEVTRRQFSWAAVAWVGFAAAIGGCVSAMTRFMFPNVLYEPPTNFKVGRPDDFPPGVVDTRFVDQYGVWVVNEGGRIFSLIAICTHLGCPPAWLATQNKFKCPCHGSGYYKSGINFEGPTPRPLERARVYISPDDGQIVVDKAQKFQWEMGQWEDPNSYISIA
ncbi:MAG TPA: Rieske 2Fe-2S domain-containing protein [Thermoanaerobaculia bacterium]|nr:Rieske 2Fe-2S domain-containing protein [Thermoanaerobaculia bacterium]